MRTECLNSRYAYDQPLPISRLVNMIGSSILSLHARQWHTCLPSTTRQYTTNFNTALHDSICPTTTHLSTQHYTLNNKTCLTSNTWQYVPNYKTPVYLALHDSTCPATTHLSTQHYTPNYTTCLHYTLATTHTVTIIGVYNIQCWCVSCKSQGIVNFYWYLIMLFY